MAEKISLHCIVQGRVQGVYFRDSTRRKAQTLGVTGWVRNLPDGSVEVLMSGEAALVAQLREWLWQGPALAAVKNVIVTSVPWQEFTSFVVLDEDN